ncbi:MAG: GGDEF domain-containing protein [Candidatus Gastranaerophilaceae bacterium]|nr:GGDEF domain-containing protein [Candidatus Gastranaerophilaceae bacterium]
MGEDFDNIIDGFDIPDEVMEKIQKNIEEIITNFPVPEDNKLDVIKKINFMYSRTRYLSLTDALTGLYNRRHFDNTVEREFLRSKRYGGDLTIAIIDIDFFKKINDTYGHLCGDYVLKEVAYLISDNFRKTDLVFRYGGEEFVALLTETSLESAKIPLERLRKKIENSAFIYAGQKINVTVSIGASVNNAETVTEFLDNADKALYKAKNAGRNKLIF